MDQETAVEELRERYARGGVPLDEYRRLMGLLMVTTDPAECQAILDQLPPEPAHRADTPAMRSEGSSVSSGSARKVSAFFGEVDRTGDLWELGPETHVNATFGEVRLDVRLAKLSEGENVLYLNALFGEIVVMAPVGLRVIIHGQARFGEVATPGHRAAGMAQNGSFTLGDASASSYLRIEAKATFGEIRIIAV
jgi:predicted membrane protein